VAVASTLARLALGRGTTDEALLPPWAGAEPTLPRVAVSEGADADLLAVRSAGLEYLGSFAGAAPTEALYDLGRDPYERVNLARQRPEVLRRLRLAALDYLVRHRPGRYLAVVGDGTPRRFRISLQSSADPIAATVLFGLGPSPATPARTVTWAGTASDALVLLARLAPANAAALEIAITASGAERFTAHVAAPVERFSPIGPAELDRLSEDGRLAWRLWAGPPATAADTPTLTATLPALAPTDLATP
jgi:hypothetical protein